MLVPYAAYGTQKFKDSNVHGQFPSLSKDIVSKNMYMAAYVLIYFYGTPHT